MIYKGTFTVVLDACVLYPAPLRDLLLRLASENLYRPKWTDEINDEWKRNLLKNRKDLDKESLDNTINLMNKAFGDAKVRGYINLIDAIKLPDADDRHVFAAAIRCNADLIVTENLRDFPAEELGQYDIGVQNSDTFIQNLIGLDVEACCRAFRKQREALDNPPKTKEEMRDALQRSGLQESADFLYVNCKNN
jgi:predicted nucleic acid-binding protein